MQTELQKGNMKVDELWDLSRMSVGDLPINNVAPLLQKLGSNVCIGDLIPFVNGDPLTIARLSQCLIARGYTLNHREWAVGQLLEWKNVLVAPAVIDVWKRASNYPIWDHFVPMRQIKSEDNDFLALREENKKTSSGMEGEYVQDVFAMHKWKLVYCTSLPIRQLLTLLPEELAKRVIILHDGKAVDDPTKESWPWLVESPVEGYYLIDFRSRHIYDWNEQEKYMEDKGVKRLSVSAYVQSCLSHLLIKGRLPLRHPSSSAHHWGFKQELTHNTDAMSVCVTQEGDGTYNGNIVIRSFSKAKPSRLRNTGVVVYRDETTKGK